VQVRIHSRTEDTYKTEPEAGGGTGRGRMRP
jgi:hypothetical protein